MKTVIILIYTIFLPSFISAQFECDFIKLCSQEEIDNFPKYFGHCSKIFSIEIDDNCNKVTNLDSLYGVVELGVLFIHRIDTLQSINGLRNLRKIGKLNIVQLLPYPAFPKLDTVTYLTHYFVGKELDLSLYSNIKHIDSSISLLYNGQFKGLPEFTSSSLFRIAIVECKQSNNLKNLVPINCNQFESLNLSRNENLSLEGLEDISKINKISFSRNNNCDFTIVNQLDSIKRFDITIEDANNVQYGTYSKITNLEDLLLFQISNLKNINILFPNLKKISSYVSLRGNKHIVDISLMDSFDLPGNQPLFHITLKNRIILQDNPLLADCASPYICKALQVYPDSVIIQNNGENCDKVVLIQACISATDEENNLSKDFLFPNPTSDMVSWSPSSTFDEVQVINSTGQVLYSASGLIKEVDISHLSPGIYFVLLKNKLSSSVHRMVKI